MNSQILQKSTFLLELLSHETEGLTVSDLARRADMNISTVHRILNAFRDRNYIVQNRERLYSLSMRFVGLSSCYLNSIDLKREADPYLSGLSEELDQTVFLATLMDSQVVYIDKHERFGGKLRKYCSIGERRPLYCTALGKSLLLGYRESDLKKYAETADYHKYTSRTIDSKERLIEEIHTSAVRGWSIDDEEIETGLRCYAVPVFDYRGHVIAAISTSGSIEAVTADREDIIVDTLKRTAGEISLKLGYRIPDQ